MSIIKRMRKQHAIWWERAALPDRFGAYTFLPPVEIKCRWEDQAVEFLSIAGEKQVSRSLVYVDRVIKIGDRLKLGVMESNETDDPTSIQNTFEVKQFNQLPNLKATETLLTAFL